MGAAVASRAESVTVNAAGLVQGIALVTFPAASTIFTAPGSYDLSRSQYGAMFVPQVIAAAAAPQSGAACGIVSAAGRRSSWRGRSARGGAHARARVLGEDGVLGLWLPARAGLLADQDQGHPVLRVDPEPQAVRGRLVAAAGRVVRGRRDRSLP